MTELKEHVMPDIAIDDVTPTCRVVGAGRKSAESRDTCIRPVSLRSPQERGESICRS
jgi:hypothetical protein